MANERTLRFLDSMSSGVTRISRHPNADKFFDRIQEIDADIWALVDEVEESEDEPEVKFVTGGHLTGS